MSDKTDSQKLDAILAMLGNVETRLGNVETQLVRQGNQIDRIETRLNRLEDSAYRAGIGGASGLPMAAKGS